MKDEKKDKQMILNKGLVNMPIVLAIPGFFLGFFLLPRPSALILLF